MHSTRKIKEDLIYVGGSDRRLSRFENLFPIPRGVSYNSYVLLDDKTVLMDTADESISRQYIENVVHALDGRPLDYMIVQHMEPDHCAMIDAVMSRYPEAKMVCTAKAAQMFAQFYDLDVSDRTLVVKEGDKLSTGEHTLHFVLAPMVHWPEVMVTYDEKDKILFSADAFGTFGALAGNIFDDEITFDDVWMNDARRYYTNIVADKGVKNIAMYDVSETDVSELVAESFRCSHIVLAAPTYNGGVQPKMEAYLSDIKALALQNRTVAIIDNGTWAPTAGKQMRAVIDTMKNMTVDRPKAGGTFHDRNCGKGFGKKNPGVRAGSRHGADRGGCAPAGGRAADGGSFGEYAPGRQTAHE